MNKRRLNQQINRFKREFMINDTDMYTTSVREFLKVTTKSPNELEQCLALIFKKMGSIKEFKRLLEKHEAQIHFNKEEDKEKFLTFMCACIYSYKKGA